MKINLKKYFWTAYLVVAVAFGAFGSNAIAGPSVTGGGGSALSEEQVEDFVGGMFGGTETGIGVAYNDADNDIDFVVSTILQKYHAIDPADDVELLLACATEAAIRTFLDLEAGTDFYSKAAIDTWRAGVDVTEMGYLDGIDSDIQDQIDLLLTIANPTFTGTLTVGSADIVEADLEVIDGVSAGGLTRTELLYIKDFTGTSGTGAICGNVSPQLTTPDLGAATADSVTIDAAATPGWVFRDLNNAGADKEIAKIYANATTTTEGAEDGEVHLQVTDSSAEVTFIQAEATTNAEFVEVGPPACTYDMHTYYSINTVNDTWSGTSTIMTVASGQTSVYGQALHVHTDGELIVADADVASSGAAPCIGLAIDAGVGAVRILLEGFMTETDWDWQLIGGPIYLDDNPATTEGLTETAPSDAADTVQILGVVISADTIYFRPSLVLVIVPA